MIILGQIPHPNLNITVFKSNNKYIVKFEIGPFEQSYKFLEANSISGFEDVSRLVDEVWLKEIFHVFDQMNKQYQRISSNIT